MKRVLLIGASGQTGKRLRERFQDGLLVAPSHPKLDLAKGDRLRSFLRENRFDVILIPGGAIHIEWCEEHPAEAWAINGVAPGIIAEEARGAHVIFFSTDAVFDGRDGPYPVDAPVNPLSVYGRSKAEGERRVQVGRWTVIRTCHIYSVDPGNNFFMFVARRLLAGEPVIGYTDQISTPTDADDLADATVRVVHEGVTGIVHLAGREKCSRYGFACEVARVFGRSGVQAGLMSGSLRPARAGLVSTLLPWREGIVRQRALYT